MQIPDHPDIQRMERDGVEPAEEYNCPHCGSTEFTFLYKQDGEVIGCTDCICGVEVWELDDG